MTSRGINEIVRIITMINCQEVLSNVYLIIDEINKLIDSGAEDEDKKQLMLID